MERRNRLIISDYKISLILLLSILGSFVRGIYGYIYTPWNIAPDQLAWEFLSKNGGFTYACLIHYPHEGGTILFSLLSYVIRVFTDFHALTILAFLADFIIRFIQISVTNKVFGNKIALFFAIWTIFPTATIIPWGTMNFGLHYIASVFPFLLIYILSLKNEKQDKLLFEGLFLGGMVWFSYSNIILVPIYFIVKFLFIKDLKKMLFSLIGFSIIILIHLFVRVKLDAGFHLESLDLVSIRGVDFNLNGIKIGESLIYMFDALANGFIGFSVQKSYFVYIKFFLFLLMIIASGGVLSMSNSYRKNNALILFSSLMLFLILYTFSPFYHGGNIGNAVSFRHLTYIYPVFSLLIIVGIAELKKVILTPYLGIGILSCLLLFTNPKVEKNEVYDKAMGWILCSKLGHEPILLNKLIAKQPSEQHFLLMQGIGWKISSHLFFEVKNGKDLELKIDLLKVFLANFKESDQKALKMGIVFSFKEEITPKLNKENLLKVEKAIQKNYI